MEDYCRLHDGFSWEDIRTKGFTVIPGFLSAEDIDKLLAVRALVREDSEVNPGGNGGNKQGYRTAALSGYKLRDVVPDVMQRMINITLDAGAEAGVHIPHPKEEEIFFTTNSSDRQGSLHFYWHQDIENYFYFQDLQNYLDFYIFLHKPHPDQAGLSLVPWDALRAHSPELYDHVKRKDRVYSFEDVGGGHMLADDRQSDIGHLLGFHLDLLACSPVLRAGDMLIFIGDVIHRTQEHSSERISLNVNVHQDIAAAPMTLAHMLQGGIIKYDFMRRNSPVYIGLHSSRLQEQLQLEPNGRELQLLRKSLQFCIDLGFSYRRALLGIRDWLGH